MKVKLKDIQVPLGWELYDSHPHLPIPDVEFEDYMVSTAHATAAWADSHYSDFKVIKHCLVGCYEPINGSNERRRYEIFRLRPTVSKFELLAGRYG